MGYGEGGPYPRFRVYDIPVHYFNNPNIIFLAVEQVQKFMCEYIRNSDNNWSINQEIEILDGPWVGFKGKIYFIDYEKKKILVKVNFWGRDTEVELKFHQIKPLE